MWARGWAALAVCMAAVVGVSGCAGEIRGHDEPVVSSAAVRAHRRAYDGAPPVVPHDDFGITCVECHNERGMEVREVGFAPPSPHAIVGEISALGRCRQCHVFRRTDALLVANDFIGLRQDLRRGARLNPLAPPTIPHKTFMRENCGACHTGPSARAQMRTPHPERVRCRQCHVPVVTREVFLTTYGPGS